MEWCDQVPALSFNCRCYDLDLIKEHFVELLADTTGNFQVRKKGEHDDVHEDKRLRLS